MRGILGILVGRVVIIARLGRIVVVAHRTSQDIDCSIART